MKVFKLRALKTETRIYYYSVEAKNLEHAKEEVENNEVDSFDDELIEREIESIEEDK